MESSESRIYKQNTLGKLAHVKQNNCFVLSGPYRAIDLASANRWPCWRLAVKGPPWRSFWLVEFLCFLHSGFWGIFDSR